MKEAVTALPKYDVIIEQVNLGPVIRLKIWWYSLTQSSNIGWTQRAFNYSKLIMGRPEQCVKYVQS